MENTCRNICETSPKNYLRISNLFLRTCIHRLRRHGDHGDHDGGNDVENWEDEVNLDWPLPLRMLISEDRNAENAEADGEPGGEANVVH